MLRAFGIAAAALSLTILVWKGFGFTFGPFLLAFLDGLERSYAYFFGFIEPYINDVLAYIRAAFHWDLHLQPHWKHTFVVMWLYFVARARTVFTSGRRVSGMFYATMGGLIALLASILAGTVSPSSPSWNTAVVFWPIAGIALFDTIRAGWLATFMRTEGYSWGGDFRWRSIRILLAIVFPGTIALILASMSGSLRGLQTLPNPGLALFLMFLVMLATYHLVQGLIQARNGNGPYLERLARQGGTRLAVEMLASMGMASFFVLLGTMGF